MKQWNSNSTNIITEGDKWNRERATALTSSLREINETVKDNNCNVFEIKSITFCGQL